MELFLKRLETYYPGINEELTKEQKKQLELAFNTVHLWGMEKGKKELTESLMPHLHQKSLNPVLKRKA